jgi:hypothetical protein
LAAIEHLLFEFDMDAEEKETRDPAPWLLYRQDLFFFAYKTSWNRKNGPKYTVRSLGLGIGARCGL